ncbi:MAG: SpoIIE family protein phosphatase [Ignavibacteriales bacterium]|nr:SpoIIE family protein phosphatase [Ignavibacteriales bacterium]
MLVLFTDGVTEAKDVKDDEYGDGRLEQFIVKNKQLNAGEIIHELLHDMHDFVQGYPQSDDITIMVLKVN